MTQAIEHASVDRLIDSGEMSKLYSVHKKTIVRWAREKSGKIPSPVFPWGPREPRWFESDVKQHQERIRHECFSP